MTAAPNHRHQHLQKPIEVREVPTPIIGAKVWVSDRMGRFLFEKGPGVLRSVNCTHTGSSYVTVSDWGSTTEPTDANVLFRMNPTVMGCWMEDVGFDNGLLVEVGGNGTTPPIVIVVWMPAKKKS